MHGMTSLLADLRVVEVGGRSARVCGRLFGQLGADVAHVRWPVTADDGAAEDLALMANKHATSIDDLSVEPGRAAFEQLIEGADVVVLSLSSEALASLSILPNQLAARYPRLVVAAITPFGLTGPRRHYRGGDLVAFHASGIARLLVGHVDDPEEEPPVRAAGEQSDFIAGLTAACAVMHAVYQQQRTGRGQLIDISAQEAMSLMAARELAMPGFGGTPALRSGRERGGSAVIPVLPTVDGFVAISPREIHQWERWLEVMGNPSWGADPRFATRAKRTANYPALFELMALWSRSRTREEIFATCQAAHVPCFPFGSTADMLDEPQLAHRGFFGTLEGPGGFMTKIPKPPFGLPPSDYAEPQACIDRDAWRPRAPSLHAVTPHPDADSLPLAGVRVLDFSWVIAGPTSTRYLALMGADVIKVEAPDRPDTGRVSELHDVLGQSKLALSIDLKAEGALDAVRRLLANTDVVVENFATGVMERLGLGYAELRAINPDIVLLSASGLGRTGPGAAWVAYGNLLSAYSGFAAPNGRPGDEPRTGLAWADPLCGLFMAFAVVAALRKRDCGGGGRHIDFSMLEGLLWTMPGALIAAQLFQVEAPPGNAHQSYAPHNVYRAAGDDAWLAVAVTSDSEWRALCAIVPSLLDFEALSERERLAARETIDGHLCAWSLARDAISAMDLLQGAGVPASASYTTTEMFGDAHLWERGFYRPVQEQDGTPRILPGLPWRWGDGSLIEPRAAPAQGQHSEHVLRHIAGLSEAEIEALRSAGALGSTAIPSANPS